MMETDSIPRYNFTIRESHLEEDVKEFVTKFIRKEWKKEDTTIHTFKEGISNILVGSFIGKSLNSATDVVLTRIYGEGTELFIDRDVEMRNMNFLHAHDCAGAVYARFANGLCYEFLPGEVGTEEMINDAVYSKLIAEEMARWHTLPLAPPTDGSKSVFQTIKRFMALVPEKFPTSEMQKIYDSAFPSKEEFLADLEDLRSQLQLDEVEMVFSHNDILIKNLVLTPDKRKIKFIDYEYGEFNYIGFDIGNHFNEFAGVDDVDFSKYPDEKFQKEWIRHYLETRRNLQGRNAIVQDSDVQRMFVLANKLSLLSHIMWGTWALVQALYSKIDFDFIGYAVIRYNEYRRCRQQRLALKFVEETGDV